MITDAGNSAETGQKPLSGQHPTDGGGGFWAGRSGLIVPPGSPEGLADALAVGA